MMTFTYMIRFFDSTLAESVDRLAHLIDHIRYVCYSRHVGIGAVQSFSRW